MKDDKKQAAAGVAVIDPLTKRAAGDEFAVRHSDNLHRFYVPPRTTTTTTTTTGSSHSSNRDMNDNGDTTLRRIQLVFRPYASQSDMHMTYVVSASINQSSAELIV